MEDEFEPKRPNGYSLPQITLHWMIVALVFFQLFFGESMKVARDALNDGLELSAQQDLAARLHVWAGLMVLFLAAVRLVVRLGYGAPKVPPGVSVVQERIALLLHIGFYLLLFTVPISGLVSWFIAPEIGWVHELSKPIFLVFIAIHVAAALYHHFVRRDEVLRRILVPKT